jgi:hypothetical protein
LHRLHVHSNGNVTNDGTNTYTWNEFSKVKALNSAQTPIYDAFGRIVETDDGSAHAEVWYTQLGKTAYLTGSTYLYAYAPSPGGGKWLDEGTCCGSKSLYLHSDWLGSARILSTIPHRKRFNRYRLTE